MDTLRGVSWITLNGNTVTPNDSEFVMLITIMDYNEHPNPPHFGTNLQLKPMDPI